MIFVDEVIVSFEKSALSFQTFIGMSKLKILIAGFSKLICYNVDVFIKLHDKRNLCLLSLRKY